jgi:hypothetical protein
MKGYTPSSHAGVSFSGVRETRHKEWDSSLLTTDHFAASAVYSKTFPAGTISIPGNNGGDGSFLIFLDKNGGEEFDSRLTAYWEEGNCGVHGNDLNWQWCGQQAGDCALNVATDICSSGEAELAHYHGTGAQGSYVDESGCRFWYLAQYRCVEHAAPAESAQMGETAFIGCFVDDGARDLGAMVGTRDNSATNTFELCRAACGDSVFMSLQYGGECFCSNSYGNGAQYVQVDESECNALVEPCRSSSYNCGGTWRQAIYQINHNVEIQNGNFELSTISGQFAPNYFYTNDVTGWTATGGTVACLSGNSPWGGVTSEGSYYLALQGSSASISQDVGGHIPGHSYTLRLSAAQRQNSPGGRNAVLRITANGAELVNEVIQSATFQQREFTYTADARVVTIRIENNVGGGDQTIFVDAISAA